MIFFKTSISDETLAKAGLKDQSRLDREAKTREEVQFNKRSSDGRYKAVMLSEAHFTSTLQRERRGVPSVCAVAFED
jgi:hypothetical protein